jgi:hypothetical protein
LSGDLGGSGIFDNCGVCNGDNSTCSDCAGEVGGEAYNNQCGTCICNGSFAVDGFTCVESEECLQDCLGDWAGIAELDNCGICDTDSNNNDTTCSQDCNDEWGGTAIVDECGVCGNGCFDQNCTEYPANEYDCDGVQLSIGELSPTEFRLMQNYPNPIN